MSGGRTRAQIGLPFASVSLTLVASKSEALARRGSGVLRWP